MNIIRLTSTRGENKNIQQLLLPVHAPWPPLELRGPATAQSRRSPDQEANKRRMGKVGDCHGRASKRRRVKRSRIFVKNNSCASSSLSHFTHLRKLAPRFTHLEPPPNCPSPICCSSMTDVPGAAVGRRVRPSAVGPSRAPPLRGAPHPPLRAQRVLRRPISDPAPRSWVFLFVSLYVGFVCIPSLRPRAQRTATLLICCHMLLYVVTFCPHAPVKVHQGGSWHFCDDPVCPDPVWKLPKRLWYLSPRGLDRGS